MKPVTFNVSEPIYSLFQAEAKKRDKKTAELIREAMELYVVEKLHTCPSLDSWKPVSLGKILADWADGSFRDEMFADRYRP